MDKTDSNVIRFKGTDVIFRKNENIPPPRKKSKWINNKQKERLLGSDSVNLI